MTRRTDDEQVIALASASASVRALAAIDGAVRQSWTRSFAARLLMKIVPASIGGTRVAFVRQIAGLVAISAVTAALLPFLGARRDGLEWVVPAIALASAGLVLLATAAARDSR